MQTIQNNALRIIFKKDKVFDIGRLHELAGLETLKERSIEQNKKYITKAILKQNPLISELFEEHKDFKTNTKKKRTIKQYWTCMAILNCIIYFKTKTSLI